MKKIIPSIIAILVTLLFSLPSHGAQKALLIGVGNYQALNDSPNREMMNLKGPVNDVRLFKNDLIVRYGFTEGEIKVLTDTQASKINIETSFRQWLINGTGKGDLVVFYFSGHGTSTENVKAILPYDMVPNGGLNIITAEELKNWLRRLEGREVVVIIDACYSGGLARTIRGLPVSTLEESDSWQIKYLPITSSQPPANARAISPEWWVPESGIFLAAAKGNEKAYDFRSPIGHHGAFTYGLHEGMTQMQAPSYRKLFEHAKKVVIDRLKFPQEPQIIARGTIAVEPAFRVRTQPQVETHRAVTPPEIVGERVLVALDRLAGVPDNEVSQLRDRISRLPMATVVRENEFYDRLIRGEKINGRYQLRLLNLVGDVERLRPAAALQELIGEIQQHLEYAYMVKQLARIHHPAPPFKITLTVTDERRREFRIGENAVFRVKSERDCYILLVNMDHQGNFHIIYPNRFSQNNLLRAHTELIIPNMEGTRRFDLQFAPPAGEETIKVIATTSPLDLQRLDIGNFQHTFQNLRGNIRIIMVREVIEQLNNNTNTSASGGRRFEWSEDTVVLRTH